MDGPNQKTTFALCINVRYFMLNAAFAFTFCICGFTLFLFYFLFLPC